MLDAFSAPGRFLRGNLHCHSTRSDGELSPERVCHFYRENGYDFICLSDHFMARYGYPITDTRSFRTNQFTTVIGAELHAPRTKVGEDWHILAVGLPLDFAQNGADETGVGLAERALSVGAFVAIPHPEWYTLTLEDVLSLDRVDAVEVYNTVCDYENGRGGGAYLLDQLLCSGRRMGAIAVDDAHAYQSDALGGWVMVKAEQNEPSAIVAALKAGHYYASQGPSIHHLERQDDHIALETSAVDRVFLVGEGARYCAVYGQGFTRARLPLEKFMGTWCRAVAVDNAGKCAWTNPLWLNGSTD
ncbi:MAG: CehA/McbA family metallohydrolase [Pseudomonadota bacterium]